MTTTAESTTHVDCGPPSSYTAATVQYTSTNSGSIATYTCKRKPPSMIGVENVICLATGQWTNPSLNCPEHCIEPDTIHPQQSVSYAYMSNIVIIAQYSCTSYPDSNPTDTCPVSPCITQEDCSPPASLSCSPADCYVQETRTYTGKVSCTVSGRTCQKWTALFPHLPVFKPVGSDKYTNYCRAIGNKNFPWCYTTDLSTRWEFCYIALC